MSRSRRQSLVILLGSVLCAGTAGAQLLPSVSLPPVSIPVPAPVANMPMVGPTLQNILQQPDVQQQIVSGGLNSVGGLPPIVASAGAPTLLELRKLRLEELVRSNRKQLEVDSAGLPVRRGILVAVDPDPTSLQLAGRAGFTIVADQTDRDLGMRMVQLAIPRGMSAREGLKRLRSAAPRLQCDYDHVYEPAGGALLPVQAALASSAGIARGRVVGMIDGGVASHPSLAGASIEQSGFAGNPQPTGHGTAVASLLVGNQGPFLGAATGSQVYVADVYGGNRAAGSATTIVKAMGWLASHHPQVINISLVGPSNAALQRAIQIVQARGIEVVAAVGNDGPAAPPQFPASYPGVVAVTGVDAGGRALPEAGRAAHVDFAAPGADMAAALPGNGYARVRGTSFAAPLAAARLLLAGSPARLATEARPGKGKVGRGIVCGDCRIDPKAVRAR